MKRLLTQKQERFTLNLFKGMSQREAYIQAGYSSNYKPAALDVNACKMANTAKVLLRLGELNQKAEDASVMSKIERKQRLSEIGRAEIPDFIIEDGIKVNKDSSNVGAVAEITTKTKVFRKNGEPINITTLKLHSPMTAIDLLNKMDKLYDADGAVNIDNRILNIYVNSEKAKDLTERLLAGERTE